MHIDLNADLGEASGADATRGDEAILRAVSSANVACGLHAGRPSTIRQTVRLALTHGVAVGAHPGYPDLTGRGRREMRVPPGELEDLVLYQVSALAGLVSAEGGRLAHIKPHGALYHMAARERAIAEAIVTAITALDRRLILFAPPGSELAKAGEAGGLTVAREGFADRAYQADGTLVPRTVAGAVQCDAAAVVAQAVRMVRESTVVAVNGSIVALAVDTICVHGDTPGAADLARHLRAGLEAAGIRVRPALPVVRG